MSMSKEPRGFALAETRLTTFDRQFAATARLQQPDRYRLLGALPEHQPYVPRGSGASYVAASFGNGATSQDMGQFNRLLAFDGERGLLHVEAGARIADVERFLIGHGWYVPVAPGHPAASIGGCIAADVHGKNPARDGRFSNWVDAIELWLPGQGALIVSPDENSERFDATFAGFGLTGTIVSAVLRLVRAPDAFVVRRMPVADLAEAAQVLREAANVPLLYGWHDARPGHFGRGVIRVGLEADEKVKRRRPRPDLPVSIEPVSIPRWNRMGIALANRWLGYRWCRPGESRVALLDAMFPLNGAANYFAGFGKAGMVEAQWLVPNTRFTPFAAALTHLVNKTKPRISLVASKLFDGHADGLAFDGRGIALAIHVPSPAQTSQRAFLDALAECAIEHGGRPNLIKDSTLQADVVRRAIPDFEALREHLRSFDVEGRVQSELTRRIGL